jgi:hypothetical protein
MASLWIPLGHLSCFGQSEPTKSINARRNEGVKMFKTFPDNHVQNNPYKILFGQEMWT